MRQFAARAAGGQARRIHLRFLVSPVEIRGAEGVEEVVIERNRIETEEGARRRYRGGRDAGRRRWCCGRVGYKGLLDPRRAVLFPALHVVPNTGGRVLRDGEVVSGEYATGWIKRGPTGLIGTNKKDATETIELLLEDARAGMLPPRGERSARGAARGARRRRGHVRGLGGDRPGRAERRRAARPAADQALQLGRTPGGSRDGP